MLRIGRFHFDPSSRDLRGPDNIARRLSPKAASVLSLLAEARGVVCSRADIIDHVWPCVSVGEEVLTHAIAELRRAFSDNASHPEYVETVHKKGYRLRAQVCETSAHPTHGPAFDLGAYGLCLQAQELFDRGGAQNTSKAAQLFSEAVERNMQSALAHAGLAKALVFSALYYDGDREKLARAEQHCMAALDVDPQSADALLVRGLLRHLNEGLQAASRDLGKALTLAPSSREAHVIAGRACYLGGEYEAAIGILERAASLRPDDFYPLLVAGKLRLKLGDEKSARADFVRGLHRVERFLTSNPDSYRAVQCQANFLWHTGRKAEAMALVDMLYAHADPMPYYTASFLALTGEHEESLKLLTSTIDAGFRHGAFLQHDPDFDSMRSDARFDRIARSVRVAA